IIMTKEIFLKKFFKILTGIDLALFVIDMTVIPERINYPVVYGAKYSERAVQLIFLPLLMFAAAIVIINYAVNFVLRKKQKVGRPWDYYAVIVVWFVYLITILLLSLFYDGFGDVSYDILRYLFPGIEHISLSSRYIYSFL
ncbi:MAG: hypothetical protein LUD81_07155, partial [Clostridiales bacterium]|nr:hypothetical protein [Clostridiales bacterium]